jgi:hypothetical protein
MKLRTLVVGSLPVTVVVGAVVAGAGSEP